MERNWRLDDDLITSDSLLDGLTFDDLILAVHCNCRNINEAAVLKELKGMLEDRHQDMMFLLKNNMDIIIQKAMEGRTQYE